MDARNIALTRDELRQLNEIIHDVNFWSFVGSGLIFRKTPDGVSAIQGVLSQDQNIEDFVDALQKLAIESLNKISVRRCDLTTTLYTLLSNLESPAARSYFNQLKNSYVLLNLFGFHSLLGFNYNSLHDKLLENPDLTKVSREEWFGYSYKISLIVSAILDCYPHYILRDSYDDLYHGGINAEGINISNDYKDNYENIVKNYNLYIRDYLIKNKKIFLSVCSSISNLFTALHDLIIPVRVRCFFTRDNCIAHVSPRIDDNIKNIEERFESFRHAVFNLYFEDIFKDVDSIQSFMKEMSKCQRHYSASNYSKVSEYYLKFQSTLIKKISRYDEFHRLVKTENDRARLEEIIPGISNKVAKMNAGLALFGVRNRGVCRAELQPGVIRMIVNHITYVPKQG